jgi:cardiolipin synthase
LVMLRRSARRHRASFLVLLLLAGCASLPAVDGDIATAARSADPQGTLDLMRRQEERIVHAPFIGGNDVRLLANGQATYAAIAAAIAGAERRIDMETYEFDPVEGARFGDLLLAKRAAGVEVNLVFDSFGSLTTPNALIERLRQGGVHVLEYNPLRFSLRVPFDPNRRDHRKLLVVDDAIVITGGVNINQVYDNRRNHDDTPDGMVWRDTDVRIAGPAAIEFEHLFERTWRGQNGPPLPPLPPAPAEKPGGALVQAVGGAPVDGHPLIYRTLIVMISLARQSIHLTTGFFSPTPDLERALIAAARRGVDIAIVVPAHSTSNTVIDAGRAHYERLLKAGVQIYEREGVVLHAKTAVIDGAWSSVGSANLDWRSVIYNNEINAVILDRTFARALEALFADDVAHSRRIDPATWSARPLFERVKEHAAHLVEFLL